MSQGEAADIEPDLNDFNRWVERKRGKPYCRQTLKDAIAKLEEIGIIRIARRFTWRVSRLVLRSLKWVKENLHNRKQVCDSSAETQFTQRPDFSSSSIKSSTPIKTPPQQVEYLCKLYNAPFLDKLVQFSIEQIRDSLKLFRLRSKQKILNPVGWLLRCINSGWWKDQEELNPELFMDSVSFDGLNYAVDSSHWQGDEVERLLAQTFLSKIEF